MKPIPGFESYMITKDGRVWSKPRKGKGGHNGKWLKPELVDGYEAINLSKNKIMHGKRVHRLVLETFVGPCPEGMECRHLNGIKTDNRLTNLKWGTHSENVYDAIKHGTHSGLTCKGEQHYKAKLTERDARIIVYIFNTGLFTQKEIAKQYSVSSGTISHIITRRSWKHIWKAA